MDVERIDHIHIVVKDLDKAIKFFEAVFGERFSPPLDVGLDDMGHSIDVRTVLSPLGLEVFAPTSERSAVCQFLDKRGEGLQAISFKVKDIELAIKHCEECGMRLIGRQTTGTLKEATFHPKDSFGFMVELCEYPETSATYLAAVDRA